MCFYPICKGQKQCLWVVVCWRNAPGTLGVRPTLLQRNSGVAQGVHSSSPPFVLTANASREVKLREWLTQGHSGSVMAKQELEPGSFWSKSNTRTRTPIKAKCIHSVEWKAQIFARPPASNSSAWQRTPAWQGERLNLAISGLDQRTALAHTVERIFHFSIWRAISQTEKSCSWKNSLQNSMRVHYSKRRSQPQALECA